MSEMNEKELLKKEIATLKRKYKKYLEMWDDCMLFSIGGNSIVEQNVHLSLAHIEDELAKKEARPREI